MIKKYEEYMKESLLDKMTALTPEERVKFYIDNKKYETLVKYSLEIFDMKSFKLGLDNSPLDSFLLKDLVRKYDFTTEQYKEILDIVDINKYSASFIKDLFIGTNDEVRKIIIDKYIITDEDDENTGVLMEFFAMMEDKQYIDFFMDKGLSNGIIFETFKNLYQYSHDEEFRYIVEKEKFDVNFMNGKMLHYIINKTHYATLPFVKVILDNGGDIYARNKVIIKRMVNNLKEDDSYGNKEIYKLFKEKDTKHYLKGDPDLTSKYKF